MFAKVAYGKGGHQDNVFAEAHEFGEWVEKHGSPDQLYIMLIDTAHGISIACVLENKATLFVSLRCFLQ